MIELGYGLLNFFFLLVLCAFSLGVPAMVLDAFEKRNQWFRRARHNNKFLYNLIILVVGGYIMIMCAFGFMAVHGSDWLYW